MQNKENLTNESKLVVHNAFRLSSELLHGFVGSEHILWALSLSSGGIASQALIRSGINQVIIRALIEKHDGIGDVSNLGVAQKLTPDATRIYELSRNERDKLKHNSIDTGHILLGILAEPNSLGARIIASTGADVDIMREDILKLFGEVKEVETDKPKKPENKNLEQFCRDLTLLAKQGKLDPVIGRDAEIQRVVQILSRRTKNNPVLIGEAGVGKTAIAEGLAQCLADGEVPENLISKRVLSLDLSRMIAGTKFRGDFENRIKDTIDEVIKDGNILLFIDELHTLIGAGSAEGAMDAANILKPALGRSEIQVIGATTLSEYRKHIEKDSALERRFQSVTVEEPTQEIATQILYGLRERYEIHHNLNITNEAIDAAVKMSSRYLGDRFLPDKAIDLIDEAASKVRTYCLTTPKNIKNIDLELLRLTADKEDAVQYQDFEKASIIRDKLNILREKQSDNRSNWEMSRPKSVFAEDIAAVVSSWTGIPITMMTKDESKRLLELESNIHKRVIGQDEAVKAVSKAVRRGRVGLKDPKRPTGSFLFLGPTGVGKTELCKALAETLFGDESAIIRIDMSEFMESHSVSKLIGSPPGYVGYDEGGQLTEKIRRKPYSIILFDEIEKANRDVFNILLQIMEDGILTDSQGRRVDFKNTVIVMTSNVGAKNITEGRKNLGFSSIQNSDGRSSTTEIRNSINEELKKTFQPEFLNRIDDVIVFHQLEKLDIRKIAIKMLDSLKDRLSQLELTFEINDDALDILANEGFDLMYGARPLRRVIQSQIEDVAAEKILEFNLSKGDGIIVNCIDGKINIETNITVKSMDKSPAYQYM